MNSSLLLQFFDYVPGLCSVNGNGDKELSVGFLKAEDVSLAFLRYLLKREAKRVHSWGASLNWLNVLQSDVPIVQRWQAHRLHVCLCMHNSGNDNQLFGTEFVTAAHVEWYKEIRNYSIRIGNFIKQKVFLTIICQIFY